MTPPRLASGFFSGVGTMYLAAALLQISLTLLFTLVGRGNQTARHLVQTP